MPIAILVHGGAGPQAPDDHATELIAGCAAAARAGHAVLRGGGSALDAVEVAVTLLEDDPLFNAGTGSALNADGEVEMDASIMDGAHLAAGAVAAVRALKNPIRLARLIMVRTPHVLIAGLGAERLARELGVPPIDPRSLITDRSLARWKQFRAGSDPARVAGGGSTGGPLVRGSKSDAHGTVGTVALDAQGHLAAATSTGGTVGKLAGRVGDSPLIGCGTYADDLAGAASATGHGESIIKVAVARAACERLRAGATAAAAARQAVAELSRVGGHGGIILLDRQGRVGFAFDTARMSRAWVDTSGKQGAGFGP